MQFATATHVLVFDVESVGLHGVGFAYGAVVVELKTGRVVEESRGYCWPSADPKWGLPTGFKWISEHVLPHLARWSKEQAGAWVACASPREVRERFWSLWREWVMKTDAKVLMAADCAWPVEARFLAACADDDKAGREYAGPYPLIDISTVLAVSPVDVPRTKDEPEHDPVADARHSARQLLAALAQLGDRA